MLLIHPPIAKPGEPPAGIAKIAGTLRHHGLPVTALDASIEGFHYLLNLPLQPEGTFSRRAVSHAKRNLQEIRTWDAYHTISRYTTIVNELNRIPFLAGQRQGVRATFSNYTDASLSPVNSRDLLRAAQFPETNLFYPYFERRLMDLLSQNQFDWIGFSLNYLSQALTTFAMIGFIKKRWPQGRIVLGGGLVSSWMSRPGWTDPFTSLVDHMVQGSGEAPLLALHGLFPEASNCYRPDYSLFDPDLYFSPGLILPYATSAGCYWGKCSFCPESAEKNRYYPYPAEKVVSDLAILNRDTDPTLVHLLDNALSPSMMKALIARKPCFSWYGFARVSHDLMDPDFLKDLKESGCVMLQLGIESGDQGVLDSLQKGVFVEMAGKALKAIHRSGIATYAYLLFGTPPESQVQARHTLDFTVENADFIDFLNIAIFNLPIDSPESKSLDLFPFYEGDLSLYSDFRHPKGWGRREVRGFLDREFKSHPAITPIIQRDPPFFNSSHAPLFIMNTMKKK